MVLKVQRQQRWQQKHYLEGLSKHGLPGPFSAFRKLSRSGVGPESLHFYYVSRNCWCRWSRGHTLRTTGLDVQQRTLVLRALG